MKNQTINPLNGSEFSSVGNSHPDVIAGHHRFFRAVSVTTKLILSICIFLLVMSLMIYLIQHLVVYIERIIFDRFSPHLKTDYPGSPPMYLYFLLFAMKPNHMKSKAILFLPAAALLVFFMAACNQNGSTSTASSVDSTVHKKLNSLFNNYWEEHLRLFPLEATFIGDNRYNDQLPNDQTQSLRDRLTAFYQSYLDSVEAFDRSRLTDEQKISYDILDDSLYSV